MAENSIKMPLEIAEAVVENMTDWVLVVDHKTHKWIYSNPACERILGYSINEVIGQDVWTTKIFPEDSRELIKKSWDSLEQERYLKNMEIEMIAKDGRKIPVNYTVSVIKGDKGDIQYRIVIIRDISQIKQLLEDLRGEIKKHDAHL